MARIINVKQVQQHISCSCGYNCVDQLHMKMRYVDLRKLGVVRKIDRTTGKPFLLLRTVGQCNGENHFEEE